MPQLKERRNGGDGNGEMEEPEEGEPDYSA